MPHLWLQSSKNEQVWVILPLESESGVVSLPVHPSSDCAESAFLARLLITRCDDPLSSREKWVLTASPNAAAHVNGMPLGTGIRVLRDKDEIRAPGIGRTFFSTERLARVEPFAGASPPKICPRCKQPVSDGVMAVCCPACGVVHHQTSELPCWLGYRDSGNPFVTCSLCDYPAAVEPDARFRWSPEEL